MRHELCVERKTQDLNEQPLKSQRNFIHSTVTLKHSCLWGGNRRDLVGFGKTGIFTWALGAWGGGSQGGIYGEGGSRDG